MNPQTPTIAPNDCYTLLSLVEAPNYAYRISAMVTDLTGGRVRLEAGNLHRALQKLVRQGLLETIPTPPGATGDNRRRYYELTDLGRRALATQAVQIGDLAAALGRARPRLEAEG